MNIALWIVQGILALAFVMAGVMKATLPKDKLKEKVGGWVDDFSINQIKTIGILELLGGLGMVLPMAILKQPILTPFAGIGLALAMVGAMIAHKKRGEQKEMGVNAFLLLMALFVVVGRLM